LEHYTGYHESELVEVVTALHSLYHRMHTEWSALRALTDKCVKYGIPKLVMNQMEPLRFNSDSCAIPDDELRWARPGEQFGVRAVCGNHPDRCLPHLPPLHLVLPLPCR